MAQSVGSFDHFLERDSNCMRLGKTGRHESKAEEQIDKLIDGHDNTVNAHLKEEYRVLKTFKFTSERKCSSIVVRAPDG